MSVTTPTKAVSTFSSLQYFSNSSLSFLSIKTAILSWDSEIAISDGFRPSYFNLTLERSISIPSYNSPMATETPPAPKSLHFFISFATSLLLNNLWSFLSSGAFPFWTWADSVIIEVNLWDFDEPVAPPIPSLPVLPPINKTISSFFGVSLFTFSFGAAAITAPHSILFAL